MGSPSFLFFWKENLTFKEPGVSTLEDTTLMPSPSSDDGDSGLRVSWAVSRCGDGRLSVSWSASQVGGG